MRGLGTLINVAAIVGGSALGVGLGHRLPERTTRTVTDALGLLTLVIGALNLLALSDADYVAAVGGRATLLVVLAALLAGGIAGSLWRIEARVEALGALLHRRFAATPDDEDGVDDAADDAVTSRARFIEGFVTASLVFTVGPLAILGAISDGLGRGIEQLVLKSALDGFASLAFASTLGWGVAASALSVGAWQGAVTLAATWLGTIASPAAIASLTATGGILLLGVGLRLLKVRAIAVADLLPALVLAPLLTTLLAALR